MATKTASYGSTEMVDSDLPWMKRLWLICNGKGATRADVTMVKWKLLVNEATGQPASGEITRWSEHLKRGATYIIYTLIVQKIWYPKIWNASLALRARLACLRSMLLYIKVSTVKSLYS